ILLIPPSPYTHARDRASNRARQQRHRVAWEPPSARHTSPWARQPSLSGPVACAGHAGAVLCPTPPSVCGFAAAPLVACLWWLVAWLVVSFWGTLGQVRCPVRYASPPDQWLTGCGSGSPTRYHGALVPGCWHAWHSAAGKSLIRHACNRIRYRLACRSPSLGVAMNGLSWLGAACARSLTRGRARSLARVEGAWGESGDSCHVYPLAIFYRNGGPFPCSPHQRHR